MKRAAAIAILAGSFLALGAAAGEIGFIEDFSLDANRAKALSQLIAGKREHRASSGPPLTMRDRSALCFSRGPYGRFTAREQRTC